MIRNISRKKLLSAVTGLLTVLVAVVCALPGMAQEIADSSAMADIFLNMTVAPAEILTRSQREELLSNWKTGKRPATVLNSVYTVSELNDLDDSRLSIILTKVSRLTLNVIRTDKNENIVVSVYTVGADGAAPDSDISFYTPSWTPLRTDRLWKTPEVRDFLAKNGDRKADLKKIARLVPFPTFEYTVSPDGKTVTGRMTVGEYLSEEERAGLEPYLVPERVWKWDGKRYRLNELKKTN